MEIPLQLSAEEVKYLGAQDGRTVREELDRLLARLDIALYRAFTDAAQPIDIYQLQGASKTVQKLREALAKTAPTRI